MSEACATDETNACTPSDLIKYHRLIAAFTTRMSDINGHERGLGVWCDASPVGDDCEGCSIPGTMYLPYPS